MDLLKVYPSGRVTASTRKKFNLDRIAKDSRYGETQPPESWQTHIPNQRSTANPDLSEEPATSLGLSSVSNLTATSCPPPKILRKRRGSNGISSRSRQLVKDAATLLQEKYGKKHLAFVTHTIPTRFITEIHQNWTKILHNLRRRYIRSLQKAGLSKEIVMVTEYQEDRLATSGQAVLHVHIVFQGRHKRQSWAYDVEHYKQHWKECCENYISNASSDAEWNAATRVEGIRKSCSSYLAKYMSKGVATLNHILSIDALAYIPSSWHVLTQRLRVEVRQNTRHFEGTSAEELFEYLTQNAVELLKFNRYVKVLTTDGREICVGWYGDLKDKKLFRSCAVVPTLLVA